MKRDRTKRREVMRDLEKLAEARRKLAALEPGGSPERPFEVDSASQIEGRAEALPCLRCEGELKLREHRSIVHPKAGALRELELACKACGEKRVTWYRVGKLLS